APAVAETTIEINQPDARLTFVEPRIDGDRPYWEVALAGETTSADAVVVWWDEDGRGPDDRLGPFPVDSYGRWATSLTFRTPVGGAHSDRQVIVQPTAADGTPLEQNGEKSTDGAAVQASVIFRLLPYVPPTPVHQLIPIDWWPAIWVGVVLILLLIRPRNLRFKDKGTILD